MYKEGHLKAIAFHAFTNNSILNFSTLDADTVVRSTYGNIGSEKTSGFSLSGNTTIATKATLNMNSSLHYITFTGILNDKPWTNAGFVFNVVGFLSYRFYKNWRLSSTVGYTSPYVFLQGKAGGNTWNSISLNKAFLRDKKASINLNVTNPFQKNRLSFTELNDPTFYQLRQSYTMIRRYNLSFSYHFGRVQNEIAHKKRGIKNDDLKVREQTNPEN
ncbi:MAG: outer membrane beta-barrel protein [Flavisolibacter sp.]|nr:outer membrane beta-barrel protein [Flavisolibacter sp.]